MNEWAKHFFKKSQKEKGFLYCCKRTIIIRSVTGNERTQVQWKYGKTKNIEKRMKFYDDSYELLYSYPVNHLSLREKMIHESPEIEDDRQLYMKNGKDEHVDFDICETVKFFANSKIELDKKYEGLYIGDENNWYNFPHYILMELLHF
jgi:hypothetical protein